MKIGLVLVLFVLASSATNVPLVLFSANEVAQNNARCLDGSPAGYYLYKTSNPNNANNWVFWLEGGGWCFPNSPYPNVDNCYNRLGGGLGSSKYWPSSMNIGFFRDYNYVYLQYCSGDFHSGTQTTASNGLYYAGHLILQAVVAKLKQTDTLSNAKLVLLTGGSAGGLGVIANFDWMAQQFPNAAFKAWPSSGWFPEDLNPIPSNYISLDASFSTLYSQVKPYLNQACLNAHRSEPWRCYSGTNVFPYIGNQAIFISQSLFDNWAQGFNGVSDLTSPQNVKFLSHFGQAMRNSFAAAQQASNNVGLFLITDNVHEFGTGTVLNGQSLQTIAGNWIDGNGQVKNVGTCPFINCQTYAPYQGCYIDNPNRDLPYSGPQGTITVESCQNSCRQNNYRYAGLQNGRECWCGNAFGKYGTDLSACNLNCTGDATEFCGQAWRNDIYTV
eukprot:Phypoly_transcript_07290.p1 GENE.Phypoly_transcript_07290~~Phypoly_transcript_07290.p1  ORF type:complete len:443 (+),score=46.68 Phypoly_transcript_07290:137-1465(+)